MVTAVEMRMLRKTIGATLGTTGVGSGIFYFPYHGERGSSLGRGLSAMERRLRESTARLREWTGTPTLRRIAGAVMLPVSVGLFLAIVVAFGLGALPFLLRVALLLAYSGVAAIVARACWWAARKWRVERLGWAGASLVLGLLMTAPVAALVWTVAWALHGGTATGSYPKLIPMTFAVSVVVCLLRGAIGRPTVSREAVARPFARLPVALRRAELWAVQGEDHYVRFITAAGDALVHMRLGHAMAELEGVVGRQVHRSWWVAECGVARVVRSGGPPVLILRDGRRVPVSRTYRRFLRECGWF
jgi:hypothetical protein